MVEVSCRQRETLERTAAHAVALECLFAGIEAAHPAARVADSITVRDDALTVESVDGTTTAYDLASYDDVVLLGGGNAAGHFAAALEAAKPDRLEAGDENESELGAHLTDGVVVTDDPTDTAAVDVLSGEHPIPSADGVDHTRRLLERAAAAGEDDLVLAVITGGGSALLAAPADPLSLSDLRAVTEELLACGASIDEINAVRKHCSAIKGGQLARVAAPATVATLALSDVVGDDPSVIASGPTVPDPSTYADALGVLERYDLDVPESVREHLEAGERGDRPETPTADDPVFERTDTHVVGNGRTALEAAGETAAARGYEPLVLAAGVRGEARESALTHAAIAAECRTSGSPVSPPAVLLSGGETTVTLGDDHGRGGPNQEFVLSAALELEDEAATAGGLEDETATNAGDIVVASVDTDGIDGATDAAGAIADGTTVPADAGREALERNDALPVLDEANAVIRTGATGTNVNDLRAIVVESAD